MAEALHRSSDIPNFDTYPASPESSLDPRFPPESPIDHRLPSGGALEQCAIQIGSALGRTVPEQDPEHSTTSGRNRRNSGDTSQ